MYYIGIDIAKRAHEVCFMDQDGQVLDGNSFKIPNTLSGVDKLQQMLDRYTLTPQNAQVGMEATGHYWKVLRHALVSRDYRVDVINPLITSREASADVRGARTTSSTRSPSRTSCARAATVPRPRRRRRRTRSKHLHAIEEPW